MNRRESSRHFKRDVKFVFRTTVTSVEEHLENLGPSEQETKAVTNSCLDGSVIFIRFCELIITLLLQTIEFLTFVGFIC
jgi:hypothetical protein